MRRNIRREASQVRLARKIGLGSMALLGTTGLVATGVLVGSTAPAFAQNPAPPAFPTLNAPGISTSFAADGTPQIQISWAQFPSTQPPVPPGYDLEGYVVQLQSATGPAIVQNYLEGASQTAWIPVTPGANYNAEVAPVWLSTGDTKSTGTFSTQTNYTAPAALTSATLPKPNAPSAATSTDAKGNPQVELTWPGTATGSVPTGFSLSGYNLEVVNSSGDGVWSGTYNATPTPVLSSGELTNILTPGASYKVYLSNVYTFTNTATKATETVLSSPSTGTLFTASNAVTLPSLAAPGVQGSFDTSGNPQVQITWNDFAQGSAPSGFALAGYAVQLADSVGNYTDYNFPTGAASTGLIPVLPTGTYTAYVAPVWNDGGTSFTGTWSAGSPYTAPSALSSATLPVPEVPAAAVSTDALGNPQVALSWQSAATSPTPPGFTLSGYSLEVENSNHDPVWAQNYGANVFSSGELTNILAPGAGYYVQLSSIYTFTSTGDKVLSQESTTPFTASNAVALPSLQAPGVLGSFAASGAPQVQISWNAAPLQNPPSGYSLAGYAVELKDTSSGGNTVNYNYSAGTGLSGYIPVQPTSSYTAYVAPVWKVGTTSFTGTWSTGTNYSSPAALSAATLPVPEAPAAAASTDALGNPQVALSWQSAATNSTPPGYTLSGYSLEVENSNHDPVWAQNYGANVFSSGELTNILAPGAGYYVQLSSIYTFNNTGAKVLSQESTTPFTASNAVALPSLQAPGVLGSFDASGNPQVQISWNDAPLQNPPSGYAITGYEVQLTDTNSGGNTVNYNYPAGAGGTGWIPVQPNTGYEAYVAPMWSDGGTSFTGAWSAGTKYSSPASLTTGTLPTPETPAAAVSSDALGNPQVALSWQSAATSPAPQGYSLSGYSLEVQNSAKQPVWAHNYALGTLSSGELTNILAPGADYSVQLSNIYTFTGTGAQVLSPESTTYFAAPNAVTLPTMVDPGAQSSFDAAGNPQVTITWSSIANSAPSGYSVAGYVVNLYDATAKTTVYSQQVSNSTFSAGPLPVVPGDVYNAYVAPMWQVGTNAPFAGNFAESTFEASPPASSSTSMLPTLPKPSIMPSFDSTGNPQALIGWSADPTSAAPTGWKVVGYNVTLKDTTTGTEVLNQTYSSSTTSTPSEISLTPYDTYKAKVALIWQYGTNQPVNGGFSSGTVFTAPEAVNADVADLPLLPPAGLQQSYSGSGTPQGRIEWISNPVGGTSAIPAGWSLVGYSVGLVDLGTTFSTSTIPSVVYEHTFGSGANATPNIALIPGHIYIPIVAANWSYNGGTTETGGASFPLPVTAWNNLSLPSMSQPGVMISADANGNPQANFSWASYQSGDIPAGYSLSGYTLTVYDQSTGTVVYSQTETGTTAGPLPLVQGDNYTTSVTPNWMDPNGSTFAGTASAVTSFTATSPAPGKVTALSATPGTNMMDLQWSKPASGANPSSYTVTWRPVDDAGNISGPGTDTGQVTVPWTQTIYQVTGLMPGTDYVFTVTANAQGIVGPTSQTTEYTLSELAPGPVSSLAPAPGNGEVTLNFTAPAVDNADGPASRYSIDYIPILPSNTTYTWDSSTGTLTLSMPGSGGSSIKGTFTPNASSSAYPFAATGATSGTWNPLWTSTYLSANVSYNSSDASQSQMVGGLQNGFKYQFGVLAFNGAGVNPLTEQYTTSTPEAVQNSFAASLAVLKETTTSPVQDNVTLTFTPSAAGSYTAELIAQTGSTLPTGLTSQSFTVTSAQVNQPITVNYSIPNGTSVYAQVTLVPAGSAPTVVQNTNTVEPSGIPFAPTISSVDSTATTASNVTTANAVINWVPSTDTNGAPNTDYIVTVINTAGATVATATVPAWETPTFTFTGLADTATAPFPQYEAEVTAQNSNGYSAVATLAFTAGSNSTGTTTPPPNNGGGGGGGGGGVTTIIVNNPAPTTNLASTAPTNVVSSPSFSNSSGYYMVAKDGGVFSFNTPFKGSLGDIVLNKPITGMAFDPSTGGYWLVATDGGVFSLGGAHFHGSLAAAGSPAHSPVVAIIPTADGGGYWLVDNTGRVFAFGDASSAFGGVQSLAPGTTIVGGVATPDGGGYYLFGSDGGVFTFGDANFHGSLGNLKLNSPIVGGAVMPDNQGYMLFGADGGVFTFGSASAIFHGSAVGKLPAGVTAIGGKIMGGTGYYVFGSDGSTYAFGTAVNYGGMNGTRLNQPMIGDA